MKVGRMKITYEKIGQALGLPEGNEVVGVDAQSFEGTVEETISILVCGRDMPEHREGEAIQTVKVKRIVE